MKKTASKTTKILLAVVLIALPVLTAFFCLAAGRYPLSVADVWGSMPQVLSGEMADNTAKIVGTMRLPRILLAMIVGAGLSVAGTAFQSLFGNPLATPDTLGVASGAGFGAAVGILLGQSLIGVQLTALLMGFLAVAITYLIGRGKSEGMTSVVLGGMVVSSLFSALISLVKFVADTDSQLPAITYWLMGSLSAANYKTLLMGLPFILIGCLSLYLIRWRMNILPLSDDEARSTGTALKELRILTIVASTMITAASVSMCGLVSWVGLLIPHICRMMFGSDTRKLVPASMSLGAVFMILMDTAARSMTEAEIPVSILTAIIGAPVFISLLRKTGGFKL
ncbi:MAG: iron ABC transporter permease [Clostridiales bacterium]|nr:iron ABC transporter permease [Clostridiales bacterium]